MKCSERLLDTCRCAFAEWRRMVWPNLLFGSAMILFSLWLGLSCVYSWNSPRQRVDVEEALLCAFLLPLGLWWCYDALRDGVIWVRELTRDVKKLPAERALELDFAALRSRLQEAAACDSAVHWQVGEGFVLWEQPNSVALYAHVGTDERYALLFRTGKGQRLGLGRVKGCHEAEGMKLPSRFKRVAVEGCAFWQAGQLAVYPASLMPVFEADVLPILVKSTPPSSSSFPSKIIIGGNQA